MNESRTSEPTRTWHIYWQAAVGRDLLGSPSLAERIRSRLLGAHAKSGRELLYYLITPDEIHMLSRLPANQSARNLARGVANVLARWVRDEQGTMGPVFARSYQAREVDGLDELRAEVRMLAWRPVAMRLRVAPTHYRHSALRIALGFSQPDRFRATALLSVFGSSVLQGRTALRKWLAKCPSSLEVLQWELSRGIALASGSVGPMGSMARQVLGPAAALVAASEHNTIEGALCLLERWVAVKLNAQWTPSLSRHKGFRGTQGRAIVAILAVDTGLCTFASVARFYHRAKATLSEQISASRARPEDQLIVATPVELIVSECVALAMEHAGSGIAARRHRPA